MQNCKKGSLSSHPAEHLSSVEGLLQGGVGKRPGAVRQTRLPQWCAVTRLQAASKGLPRPQIQRLLPLCIKSRPAQQNCCAGLLHLPKKAPVRTGEAPPRLYFRKAAFTLAHQSMRLLTCSLLETHPFWRTAPATPLRAAQRSAQKRP